MSNRTILPSPALLMSGFFAASFFVNGIVLPFFPVVLTDKGLSGDEVAMVLAIPYLARILSMPIITGLADRVRDRRVVVIGLAGSILAAVIAFGVVTAHWAVIAAATLMLVLSFCTGPLSDAIALSVERRGQGDYGRMRLWGSVSFIVANLIGGVALQHGGTSLIYALMVAGFAVSLLSSFMIPPAGPIPASMKAASLVIVRKRAFLMVLAAAGCIQASHAALYGFASLTWQARGYDDATIGVLWAIGVIAEIVLFALAWRIPQRIDPRTLIAICGAIGVVRWMLFAGDFGPVMAVVVQVMHAGSFATGHIGIMRYIRESVPDERSASAQGTYVICVGLAMAAATAISGRLWTLVGDDCFMAMSVFSAVGLAVLTITRLRSGGAGVRAAAG